MVVSVFWDGDAGNKKGLSDPGEALRTFAAVLNQRAQAPNAPSMGVFVVVVRFMTGCMGGAYKGSCDNAQSQGR